MQIPVTPQDIAEGLYSLFYKYTDKIIPKFDELMSEIIESDKLTEYKRTRCEWEIIYFIFIMIYLHAGSWMREKVKLSENTTFDIIKKYLNVVRQQIEAKRGKEEADNECARINLRINAYVNTWNLEKGVGARNEITIKLLIYIIHDILTSEDKTVPHPFLKSLTSSEKFQFRKIILANVGEDYGDVNFVEAFIWEFLPNIVESIHHLFSKVKLVEDRPL